MHKHASVGIKAEHYPIVGRHLLNAIKEVLGDAAAPELIAAWAEAYGELADALISAEKALYEKAGTAPGGLRTMRVVEVSNESENVKSFTLAPAAGDTVPAFKPGQYVSVSVTFPDRQTQLRQYSLSDAPQVDRLCISVKREEGGESAPAGRVSNWLHDHVCAGMTLQITHPFGEFAPDTASDEPIVLLSAGVGITPMIAVLNQIAQASPARKVLFAYAARSSSFHPHRKDLDRAKAVMPHLSIALFYEEVQPSELVEGMFEGRMELAKLPQWQTEKTNVYLCGPLSFMQAQWKSLLAHGVPAARLHREVFGPELLNHLA